MQSGGKANNISHSYRKSLYSASEWPQAAITAEEKHQHAVGTPIFTKLC